MMYCVPPPMIVCFFFFNDTATTEIYTLSLHDALPICGADELGHLGVAMLAGEIVLVALERRDERAVLERVRQDRKSTRLNSSHSQISYAVFCLKKKKQQQPTSSRRCPHSISVRPPART